jgi:hypothetical protein
MGVVAAALVAAGCQDSSKNDTTWGMNRASDHEKGKPLQIPSPNPGTSTAAGAEEMPGRIPPPDHSLPKADVRPEDIPSVPTVIGKVVAKEKDSVTVRSSAGKDKVLRLGEGTTVTYQRLSAPEGALVEGAEVRATYDVNSDVAKDIEVLQKPIGKSEAKQP